MTILDNVLNVKLIFMNVCLRSYVFYEYILSPNPWIEPLIHYIPVHESAKEFCFSRNEHSNVRAAL